jgi:tetratricopeptide (TPR) repeat protein
MTCALRSITFVLAIATLGRLAAADLSQLMCPVPRPALDLTQYHEVQEAVKLATGPRHDMPGALKLLEHAAQGNPELPAARVVMYQILVQLKEPAAARRQLEEAVKLDPSDPDPYVILGGLALQEQRVSEAELDFDKARQLAVYASDARKAATEPQLLSGLAGVAEAHDDWAAAAARLQDLLRLGPQDPNLELRQRLARALFRQGSAQEAYSNLKVAKSLDRENALRNKTQEVVLTPEAIMGQYYEQYEGPGSVHSEVWFLSALKHAPNDLPTRRIVGVWALERGKLALAKEQAENAERIEAADAKLDPQARKYRGSRVSGTLRGLVALWEKDWPAAEGRFQKIVNDSPTDFAARNGIALALAEQDDAVKKDKALTYAEANYRDNSDNPEASSTLAWVHFRRGEIDRAGMAIDRAVKAAGGTMSPDMATYQAHILHHRGRDQEAKAVLEDILRSDRPFAMRPEAQKLFEKVKNP